LIHIEVSTLVELQASLPGVPESVLPFTGKAVFLVPYEFLGPKPALLAQLEDQLYDIGMTLAVQDSLLYVEDEGSGRLENSKELLGARQEPLDVCVGLYPP